MGSTSYNDLWKYQSGLWTLVDANTSTGGNSAGTTKPNGRSEAIAWNDNNGNFLLFGGKTDASNYFNDVWKYNVATTTWTKLSGDNTSNQPGIYNTGSITTTGSKPGSRTGHSGWADNSGNLFVFGGEISAGQYMSDTWRYDLLTNLWTFENGSTTPNQPAFSSGNSANIAYRPGARRNAAFAVAKYGHLWIFGGLGYESTSPNKDLGDLWRSDIDLGPTPGIISPSSASFCTGNTVTLNVSGNTPYLWLKNGALISGAISASYNVNQQGNLRRSKWQWYL